MFVFIMCCAFFVRVSISLTLIHAILELFQEELQKRYDGAKDVGGRGAWRAAAVRTLRHGSLSLRIASCWLLKR